MSAGEHVSDVLRTAIVWGTVALLGYLGFLLFGARAKDGADVQTENLAQFESIGADIDALKTALADHEQEQAQLRTRLLTIIGDREGEEYLQRAFDITMLVAKYEGEEIHVFGRIRCVGETWESVKLAFTFRGKRGAKLHVHHYELPDVTPMTPFARGIKHEFDFRIARFHENWLEYNVSARVVSAVRVQNGT